MTDYAEVVVATTVMAIAGLVVMANLIDASAGWVLLVFGGILLFFLGSLFIVPEFIL